MKKLLSVAGVAAVAISAMAATPAWAVSAFPEGDTYIAIACDTTGDPEYNLNSIAADGTSTAIGTALYSDENCFADGSYNQVDGKYYAWDWNTDALFAVDVETGEQFLVGDGSLSLDGSPLNQVAAVFVDLDGTVYIVGDDGPSTLYSTVLGATESDPTVLTAVGVLPTYTSTMAVNPVTGKVYAQDPSGDLYEVSLADASEIANYPTNCDTGGWGNGGGDCWGIDFDSNGGLWYQSDNGNSDYNSMLASATLPENDGDSITLVAQGTFYSEATGGWYGESTGIIWGAAPAPTPEPEPELAATGMNSGAIAATAFGSLVLIAGGLMVARRRNN